MLTLIRTAIAAAILLSAAWLAVLWVGNSSPYQECVANGEQHENTEADKKGLPHLLVPSVIARCTGEFVDKNNGAITAISTVVIAIFTTVLGLFTVSLAKSTRLAADAADLSAKAVIALELPLIRAHAQTPSYGGITPPGATKPRPTASVNQVFFINRGRTRAFPIEIQIGSTFGQELPKRPVYKYTKPSKLNAILEPEADEPAEVLLHEFEFEAPPDTYNLLREKKTSWWFYCKIIYLDFMQTRHEAGFCWKCNATVGSMGTFIEDATPAYNRKT
jgi:hypothetical protein